jgi:hypothetical protein
MTLLAYLYGVTSMGSGVVALFFMRYYQVTKDELFIWFALAFATFAASWGVVASGWHSEEAHLIYGLRLVGFVLLSFGIFRKNRNSQP